MSAVGIERQPRESSPSGGAIRKPCFKIPAKFVDLEPCQSNNLSPSPNLLHAGEAFQALVSSCLKP